MSKVVYLEEANDFQHAHQKINSRDILTAIYSPNEPTLHPSRVGELHFQIMEGSGNRLKAWVAVADHASGASWEELTVGSSSEVPDDVVRKNQPNDFNNVDQTIGTRQIVTIIDGGSNSVPNHTAPDFDGQVFLSYRNAGTDEAQAAIWIAKGNQWLPIAVEGGSMDGVAKLDESNVFTKPQKIGTTPNQMTITSGRRTSFDPTDSASPDILPFAAGDIVMRDYLDAGIAEHQVFMATVEGDAASWINIFDSKLSTVGLDSRITLLDGRLDTLGDKLDMEIEDLDRLGETVGTVDLKLTGIEGDISLLGTKVELIEPRVIANEEKITALETHHNSMELDIGLLQSKDKFTDSVINGNLSQAEFGNRNTVIVNSERAATVELPEIITNESEATATQCRVGKRIKFSNIGTANCRVKSHGLQKIRQESGVSTATFNLKNKTSCELISVDNAGELHWQAVEYVNKPELQNTLSSHSNRLTALESSGGGSGGGSSTFLGLSDTPSTFAGQQNKGVIVNEAGTGLIFAEIGAEHAPLPNPMVADTYLVVNKEGTGFACSNETVTEINDIINNVVDGVSNGNHLINTKCMGSDTTLTSLTISKATFAKSNIVIGTTAAGIAQTVNMADIVSYTSPTLSNTQVREGCIITVVNKGAAYMELIAPAGHKIFTNVNNLTSIKVHPNCYATFYPAIYDDGSKRYIAIAMGAVNSAVSEERFMTIRDKANTANDRITALTSKVSANETAIANANEAIGVVNAGLTTANSNINGLTTKVSTVEETTSGHTASINTISGKINTVEVNVSTTSEKVAQLEIDKISLQTAIGRNTTSINEIKERLDDIRIWSLTF